ncbi:endonuclease IV, partial [Candidatus Pacearchaeota archaeon]|nr:endonuclease IV [Candidatus Pacearchaeota archaeon]
MKLKNIRFGPAGIGIVKDVEETFDYLAGLGLGAAEIPFTYGVYIKEKETAGVVGRAAKKFGIELSI